MGHGDLCTINVQKTCVNSLVDEKLHGALSERERENLRVGKGLKIVDILRDKMEKRLRIQNTRGQTHHERGVECENRFVPEFDPQPPRYPPSAFQFISNPHSHSRQNYNPISPRFSLQTLIP